MKTEVLDRQETIVELVKLDAPDEFIRIDVDEACKSIDEERVIQRRQDAEYFYDAVLLGIMIVPRSCTDCEVVVDEAVKRRNDALLIAARSEVVAAREAYYDTCSNR